MENIAKNINVILSLKDRFSPSIKKAAEATDGLSKKMSRSSKDILQFERVLNNTARRAAAALPKLAAASVAGIASGAAVALESTKELRNDLARLDANAKTAGVSLHATGRAMRELSKFSNETDSNVEAISNLLASGLNEKQMLQALDALSGAAIKFSDTLKIEGLADGFEETLATGMGVGPFGELVERLGYNLDDFNAGLQQAKKNGTELQYALEFLEQTGLAKVKQTFEETNADLVAANQHSYLMQQRMARLGSVLQPVANRLIGITKGGQVRKNSLMDLAGRGIDFLIAKLQQWEQDGTLEKMGQRLDKIFSAGAAVVEFFIKHIDLIAPAAGGAVTALAALNIVSKVAALFSIANPPLIAIGLAIAAVTTAVILLRNNWDKITATISSGVQKMQNGLNSFSKKLASIKLPSWLTELSQSVASIGSGLGRILNSMNPFQKKTVSGHEMGSAYFAGGLTRVNEGGRGEIINLPSGTQIIPHDVSKKMVAEQKNAVVDAAAVQKKSHTAVDRLKNVVNEVFFVNTVQKKPIPTHETGSAYFAGGLTHINEGGRGEIVNLPGGTQIIPHDVSKKQAAEKWNNFTINLNIHGNMIGNQQYADYIGGIIAQRVKLALNNT
ncbi:MAG: hypothetical protein IIV26_04560 [Peptococcaceae bacterium]|nr:hypothetical protein [Peptococcaceae bacterium]